MTQKNISLTSHYFRQRMLAIREITKTIDLSDFLELPDYIKEDLIKWKGFKSSKARVRLDGRGFRPSKYKKGDPMSLFPDGIVKERRKGILR